MSCENTTRYQKTISRNRKNEKKKNIAFIYARTDTHSQNQPTANKQIFWVLWRCGFFFFVFSFCFISTRPKVFFYAKRNSQLDTFSLLKYNLNTCRQQPNARIGIGYLLKPCPKKKINNNNKWRENKKKNKGNSERERKKSQKQNGYVPKCGSMQ